MWETNAPAYDAQEQLGKKGRESIPAAFQTVFTPSHHLCDLTLAAHSYTGLLNSKTPVRQISALWVVDTEAGLT